LKPGKNKKFKCFLFKTEFIYSNFHQIFVLPTSERFAAAENRDGAANVAPHQ
jgi:hypothetical protein